MQLRAILLNSGVQKFVQELFIVPIEIRDANNHLVRHQVKEGFQSAMT
ncbi:hypothetical protein SAMN05421882_104616 [Nitrosomonas communis]|uniref:Uncharacterized protein n=1 Tax=Nitrosomonas communis TaxID=44574 RepID=A0A1H2Y4A6_9PROT|nr:hypothetical protein SAMN05421882_104616 [Nitrosomonas communis]